MACGAREERSLAAAPKGKGGMKGQGPGCCGEDEDYRGGRLFAPLLIGDAQVGL